MTAKSRPDMPPQTNKPAALDGVFVLDLSRILAGPTATQLLGDLGAEIIKIENPKTGGDDTRSWGPPFLEGEDGPMEDLSAYFLCANRNKRSVSLDISSEEGQEILKKLMARADIVVENFKPGGLASYGIGHETMLEKFPGLIWCSISGFGQYGPNWNKPGYDIMAQGYGGIMSLTGPVDGPPSKVGVGIADVMCGMYATIGILAALHHREKTGQGQHIDLSLVDSQMAWLINEGVNCLTSGKPPPRRGNGHPNIVPYDVFAAQDGHVIIAVGNDAQFVRFCDFLGAPSLAQNPDYATNPSRLLHREPLIEEISNLVQKKSCAEIIIGLEALKVPVGPIHTVDQALASNQAEARKMVIEMQTKEGQALMRLLGNPLNFSHTPVQYRYAPPGFGDDTQDILAELEK